MLIVDGLVYTQGTQIRSHHRIGFNRSHFILQLTTNENVFLWC